MTVLGNKNRRIDFVDVATKQARGFELTDGVRYRRMKFSPDGQTLYLVDDKDHWRAIQYQQRIDAN